MVSFQKQCYQKLELFEILSSLKDKACLPLVKDRIESLKPSNNIDELNRELEQVDECLMIVKRLERAPIYLNSCYEKGLAVLEKGGILSGVELYDTLKLFHTIRANISNLAILDKHQIDAPYYRSLVEEFVLNEEIETILIKSVDEDGYILDSASKELSSIRKRIASIEQNIKQRLQELISKESSKLSQTNVVLRDDRYCLAVKSEYKNSIKGVICDVSSSLQTCFIEPLVITQLTSDKMKLFEKEKEEINRIIKHISNLLTAEVEILKNNFRIVCDIDFNFSKAVLALDYDGQKPYLNDKNILDLKTAKHPLLKVKKVIPNNISFGDEYLGIIITGPNTGGKTVLLKTVGLLCAMVKYGLLVPCDPSSNIMIYDHIFCDIGDDQSIQSNLSTFSSHMTNIKQIIDYITAKSLVLFDEIGSGTDPIEGSNLAKAILKYLIEKEVSFITTTHYSQLKAFAFDEDKIINASMEFDQNTLSPTYHLMLGVSGSSNAFNIAKRLGLNEQIIKDAKQMTITTDDSVRKLIFKLEKQVKQAEDKNQELLKQIDLIEKEKIKYETLSKNLELKKQQILENAQKEADSFIEKITNEALKVLNEAKQIDKNNVKLHQIINTQSKIDNLGGEVVKKQKPTVDSKQALVGDDVYISSYDQYGVINKIFKDSTYEISIGNMSLKLSRDMFKIVEKVKVERPVNVGYSKSRASISLNLDLRGKRYEEAKDLLDKYMDDLLVAGIKQANIIHGYGTGVIRELVRSYLKSNSNVDSFRYGQENEGGFGVTVVTLK